MTSSKSNKKWYKKYVRISWDRQKETVELLDGHVVRVDRNHNNQLIGSRERNIGSGWSLTKSYLV